MALAAHGTTCYHGEFFNWFPQVYYGIQNYPTFSRLETAERFFQQLSNLFECFASRDSLFNGRQGRVQQWGMGDCTPKSFRLEIMAGNNHIIQECSLSSHPMAPMLERLSIA